MRLARLLLPLLALPAALPARDYQVTLPAASIARAGQVVHLALPADAPQDPVLQDAAGAILPVQVEGSQARFVVPHQSAGERLSYRLMSRAGPVPAPARVAPAREGERLDLQAGGRPVLSYWVGPRPLPRPGIDPVYLRSGFIHPVTTPAGVTVTDSYPANHVHHHGIWSPWTKTEFQGRTPDFWNMGQRRGTVEGVGVNHVWSGVVHGGFIAQHRFVDLTAPQPVVALHETWEVTVYAPAEGARPAHVFDLVITQTCATDDPLILPEYHYGGLGFRGHAQWNGAEATSFLTSEGITDRVKAHGTRARWCHVGGTVDGHIAGTAILGHPENFRAPQPMRIHPTEPFFCYAPSQLGRWEIRPGEPYVARYRFVVTDGAPDPALLEAYWAGYAEPAIALIEPL